MKNIQSKKESVILEIENSSGGKKLSEDLWHGLRKLKLKELRQLNIYIDSILKSEYNNF